MAKRHTFWDDPKYDRMLANLAAQELYASEIATRMTEYFGFTITKNSVVGRAYRTGVEMSQPGKLKRIQTEQWAGLKKWLEKPENTAYREKRRQEGQAKWMAAKQAKS